MVFTIRRKLILFSIAIALIVSPVASVLTVSVNEKTSRSHLNEATNFATKTKAKEVRIWLESLVSRGQRIGTLLRTQGTPEHIKDVQIAKYFKDETEVLYVSIYRRRGAEFDRAKKWFNHSELAKARVEADTIFEIEGQLPIQDLQSLKIFKHKIRNQNPLLSAAVPTDGETILVLIANQTNLDERLKPERPFSFVLLNHVGTVADGKANPEEATTRDGLGSYARVGIGNLRVFSPTPVFGSVSLDRHFAMDFFVTFFLTLLGVLGMAFLLSHLITFRLERLKKLITEVSKGNFRAGLTVYVKDEITEVIRAFETLKDSIRNKIFTLTEMNQILLNLHGVVDMKKLVETMLDTAVKLFEAESAAAWILKSHSQPSDGFQVSVSKNWTGELPQPGDALFKSATEASSAEVLWRDQFSTLVLPIREGKIIRGHLLVRRSKKVSYEDIRCAEDLIEAVSRRLRMISVLSEAMKKLHQTHVKTPEKKTPENFGTLEIAKNQLFPQKSIQLPQVDVNAEYYSNQAEFGGTYWDVVPLPGKKTLVLIANTGATPLPALLSAFSLKSSCSILQRIADGAPIIASNPGSILHFLNKVIYETGGGKTSVNATAFVFDSDKQEILLSSAAHPCGYLLKTNQKEVQSIAQVSQNKSGAPLGRAPQAYYQTSSLKITEGDTFFFQSESIQIPEEIFSNRELASVSQRIRSLFENQNLLRDFVLVHCKVKSQNKEQLRDQVA